MEFDVLPFMLFVVAFLCYRAFHGLRCCCTSFSVGPFLVGIILVHFVIAASTELFE
jgi:hypothetical protein